MEFTELGVKTLTFYASMALYALSAVYALVLLTPLLSKTSGRERIKGKHLRKKKPSQYNMDDILELSLQADAYEMTQDPFSAQYMSELAIQIAEQYELSEEDRESLRIAALLHDVGQIEQCDFIQEERALRPEERHELENHPLNGYQFIKEMGPEYEKAALWVRWSHERWDGTGYPDGLAGEQIPIPARILAVVDAYCAMMQDRPYRSALSQEMAVYELKKFAGMRYDPQMVQLFEAESTPSTTALEVI